MATYGARTGVTTTIFLVDKLCRLYRKFSKYIDPWVTSQMTPENASTVLHWLAALSEVCRLLNASTDD